MRVPRWESRVARCEMRVLSEGFVSRDASAAGLDLATKSASVADFATNASKPWCVRQTFPILPVLRRPKLASPPFDI